MQKETLFFSVFPVVELSYHGSRHGVFTAAATVCFAAL